MSGDPKDTQLSGEEERIKEYLDKGYITLQKGTKVSLRIGVRKGPVSRMEEYPVIFPLLDSCLTTPSVINYADNYKIDNFNGYNLTSLELLEYDSYTEEFPIRMPQKNHRNPGMGFEHQQKREKLYLESVRKFLEDNDLPFSVEGDNIDSVFIYIEEDEDSAI